MEIVKTQVNLKYTPEQPMIKRRSQETSKALSDK